MCSYPAQERGDDSRSEYKCHVAEDNCTHLDRTVTFEEYNVFVIVNPSATIYFPALSTCSLSSFSLSFASTPPFDCVATTELLLLSASCACSVSA